ncbi:type 2 lanthipeptide synthetase LanM [Bacillus cereus]
MIWTKNQLDIIVLQSNNITLSNEALGMLMEGFFQDLISIAEKTLVYDMHSMKNKVLFDGATPQERYKFFLKTRFTTLESMMEFFNDYPTLTKLLTIRTIFFIDYIKEFVNNSDDNMNIIRGLFDYRGEGCITSVKVGAGDSHEKGKAVILFELDNSLKLVYKPKNLKIAREYYNFLNWISSQDPKFEFFIPKQIYGETFMIEGFLFHKDCKNKEEVQEFYRSFGHLIGLAHFLCGTDFHYENLIAHGKFPVLIDVETLFQHTPAINLGSDAYVKSKFDNLESVLFTGLVPFIAYTDKSEDGNSGIQLSALSGDTQKMPYKILKISNMNTDEMSFDYQEHIIEGSQNLPKVNGTKIDFRDYIPNIIKGFEEICTFFFENKKNLIGEEGIIHKFAGIKVRNVLKGTQRYGDMLNFSYHPSCTQDFIEREKLFENSWAYPYYQKEVVIHEVRDLCIGDIPVFYNKVDSKDLITSDGTIVENFHEYPPLMKSIQRIKQLDSQEIEKQTSHLMVSLGMYNQESHLLNKKAEITCYRI